MISIDNYYDLTGLDKILPKKKPFGGMALMDVGLFLFICGFFRDNGGLTTIIGAVMLIYGTVAVVVHKTRRSDSAVDGHCNDLALAYFDVQQAMMTALAEKVTDSVYVCGYCFDNMFSARCAIKGKDKMWRSSIFEMTCMFFTDKAMYYNSKRISLLTEEKVERQREFMLSGVLMVSLDETNQAAAVAITISGNETIKIYCKNREDALNICALVKSKLLA